MIMLVYAFHLLDASFSKLEQFLYILCSKLLFFWNWKTKVYVVKFNKYNVSYKYIDSSLSSTLSNTVHDKYFKLSKSIRQVLNNSKFVFE